MKRRTFILGAGAVVTSSALPGFELPAETIKFIEPALSADRLAQIHMYVQAEFHAARVRAMVTLAPKFLDKVAVGQTYGLNIGDDVDRLCSVLSAEVVDDGLKIEIQEIDQVPSS